MQISKQTFDILKNFTSINNSISVTEPSVLKTLSFAENIIGIYDCEEVFPVWHLYNSVPFMSMSGLFEDGDFDFGEKSMTLKAKGMRARFVYDSPDIIQKLGNLKSSSSYKAFDKFDGNFDLTPDKVSTIQKGAMIMGLPDMAIKMTDGKGLITVCDGENPNSNTLKVAIVGEGSCEVSIMVKNLQVISGEYNVSVSNGLLAQFNHKKLPLFYIIAAQLSE